MIICIGIFMCYVMFIVDYVVQEFCVVGMLLLGVEGEVVVDWIVVDFGDVMVYVMQEESCCLYELEKFWS